MKSESKRKKGQEKLLRFFLRFLHNFLYRNKGDENTLLSEIIKALDPALKKQFKDYYIEEMVKYVLSICLDARSRNLENLDFRYLNNVFTEKFKSVALSEGVDPREILIKILQIAKQT